MLTYRTSSSSPFVQNDLAQCFVPVSWDSEDNAWVIMLIIEKVSVMIHDISRCT
jgi:hypothetical protein